MFEPRFPLTDIAFFSNTIFANTVNHPLLGITLKTAAITWIRGENPVCRSMVKLPLKNETRQVVFPKCDQSSQSKTIFSIFNKTFLDHSQVRKLVYMNAPPVTKTPCVNLPLIPIWLVEVGNVVPRHGKSLLIFVTWIQIVKRLLLFIKLDKNRVQTQLLKSVNNSSKSSGIGWENILALVYKVVSELRLNLWIAPTIPDTTWTLKKDLFLALHVMLTNSDTIFVCPYDAWAALALEF